MSDTSKLLQEYLRNIGVVHIQTTGSIVKIYNPKDSSSSIGTHIDTNYNGVIITEKLHFNVNIDDSYNDLNVSEIRCKTIAGRQHAPDILEERFVRDPMFTSSLSKQLPCDSMSIKCKFCKHTMTRFKKDELKRFIDIPESNWEEYMDLWHCHKPTDNKEYNDDVNNVYNLLQKNRNLIIPKVDLPVLISDMSLLVYSKNLQLDSYTPNVDFACGECDSRIGKVHVSKDAGKYDSYLELYKNEISLSFEYANKDSVVFEVNHLDWLAKQILYCTSMYGSRMFKLIPPPDLRQSYEPIDIWCLDHGISIGIHNRKYDNLLKAMYKTHSGAENGAQNVQDIEVTYGDNAYNNNFYTNLIKEMDKSKDKIAFSGSKNTLNGWTPLYI